MAKYDISQVKALAHGRWAEILGLDHDLLNRAAEHPCPKCGGSTRFRVLKDFEQTGAVFCNRCFKSKNGDGLAAYAWLHDCTFPEALRAVADRVGAVPVSTRGKADSKPKEKSAAEKFQWRDWNESLAQIFCLRKKGVLATSLAECGAKMADHYGTMCVVLPIRGESRIVGFTAANAAGGSILIKHPDGGEERTKWKNVLDKPPKGIPSKGIIGTSNLWDKRDQITRIFKMEGPSDLLAVIPFLRPGEGAFCNPCGAGENPVNFEWLASWLEGKQVIVIHDRDQAGVSGALGDPSRGRLGWATWAAQFAKSAVNVELPYPLVDSGGKDFRDWVADGGTREDLEKLVESSDQVSPIRGIFPEIENYVTDVVIGRDGEERKIKKSIPLADIVKSVHREFGNWPKCVDGVLFAHAEGKIRLLTSTAVLFSWLREARKVCWANGEELATKDEFFYSVVANSEQFEEIHHYPHFPPIKGIYYTCQQPRPGDGKSLSGFLDFFTPDHPLDRQLMMACVATLFWGGPPGIRPGWLVTSPYRQGAGKSTFSEIVASLVGGSFDFNVRSDPDKDKTRLLSKEGAGKRVARFDNVKAVKFSNSALESLITVKSISGHKLFVGEGSRKNYLTWFVTMNDAELSRDLAERCVTVSLGAPKRTGTWVADINRYIAANHQGIIADVAAFFERPRKQLIKYNRWGDWAVDVLCRLDNPQEAFDLIAERERGNNADVKGAEEIEEYVHEQMKEHGFWSPCSVHIPAKLMAKWVNDATGCDYRPAAALKFLKAVFDSGLMSTIEPNPSRKNGRGWLYRGLMPSDEVATDYTLNEKYF